MRGDPEGLRRTAATLHVEGDRVRLLAGRVRGVAAVRWRSPAAELYRQRVEVRARRLEAAAEEAHALARACDVLATLLEQQAAS